METLAARVSRIRTELEHLRRTPEAARLIERLVEQLLEPLERAIAEAQKSG